MTVPLPPHVSSAFPANRHVPRSLSKITRDGRRVVVDVVAVDALHPVGKIRWPQRTLSRQYLGTYTANAGRQRVAFRGLVANCAPRSSTDIAASPQLPTTLEKKLGRSDDINSNVSGSLIGVQSERN